MNSQEQLGAIDRLATAITFATVSDPDDPNASADEFMQFQAWVTTTFPKVSQRRVTNGPANGMLWCLPGVKDELKPGILLAHHDVVPAPLETLQKWTHPPFSGQQTDGCIWGRGALDNKSNLVSILEAAEALLNREQPLQRTLYIYSGNDEEVMGLRGAKQAVEWFRAQGITAEFVIDEGLTLTHGIIAGIERPVGLIGLQEKGYATIRMRATAPLEGHSMMPPRRSLIVQLSQAIGRLEDKGFRHRLQGTARRMLSTLAPHMRWPQRLVMGHLWLFAPIAARVLGKMDATRAMLGTTVAATTIKAGLRENAVPASVEAQVNLRVAPGESVDSVLTRVRDVVGPDVEVLDPAIPIEPGRVADSNTTVYHAITEAILHIEPDAVIAPGLFAGHSDSIWFESIAINVYRFSPLRLHPKDPPLFHGINERIPISTYLDMIRFYETLIERAF